MAAPAEQTEDPEKRRLENAILYRMQRIRDSKRSIADESISDIPHIKDVIESIIQIGMTNNILTALEIAPKLVLSGVGTYAAFPNIDTIWQEYNEHGRELKRTLDLYKEHLKEHYNADMIAKKGGLDLEGIPDLHIEDFTKEDLRNAWREAHLSAARRAAQRLRSPTLPATIHGLNAATSFLWHGIKSIGLNFTTPTRLKKIFRGAVLGLKNVERRFISEKSKINKIAGIKTISEKIEDAKQNDSDTILIQDREIELLMLDPALIEYLDAVRCARRDKAQQLQIATKGVLLQSAFISASMMLTVYHLATGHWSGAMLQFSSASLAANPLTFVGEQTEELYQAIHSHAAEEAQLLSETIESYLGFPPDENGEPQDIQPNPS